MAYDLEEQEQIESLKSWWKQYGNLLTWLLIAALAAFSGWSAWSYYQRNQAAQAGQLYDEIGRAVVAKDNARVMRGAADMREKFSRIAYAAAHVVADPLASNDPWLTPAIDWDTTLKFRHRLWDLGLGVAEAMDTAQRGSQRGRAPDIPARERDYRSAGSRDPCLLDSRTVSERATDASSGESESGRF